MPSPVATAGFVVSRYTWPAPPVASSTAGRTSCARPASSRNRRRRTPVLDDAGRRRARARHGCGPGTPTRAPERAFPISRPVASRACSTRRALCAPSRQRRLAVGVAIEPRAPVHQLADVPRPFLDEHAHGRFVAQPVAGGDRVGARADRRIVRADRAAMPPWA
jgi:hypothetical protein